MEFQSTLPRGERPRPRVFHFRISRFQSTLPRGERLPSTSHCITSGYFNPRSREGSDPTSSPFSPPIKISIHAPARGATVILFCRSIQVKSISIHAPARGATCSDETLLQLHEYFNPRSREGSDNGTRGGEGVRTDFNPRSREGSDCLRRTICTHRRHFNPRSREGSDS